MSESVPEGSLFSFEGPNLFMHPVDFYWVSDPDLIERLKKILDWRIKEALRNFDSSQEKQLL